MIRMLLSVLFLLTTSPLLATSFRPMSFEEHVRNATNLCAFEIKSQSSKIFGRSVYKEYELEVLDCFKGNLAMGSIVKMSVIGGRAKGADQKTRVTMVPGAPVFEVSKSYVFSLSGSTSEPMTLEEWQSLAVEKSAENFFVVNKNSRKVRGKLHGLESVESGRWSFDEFRQKVRSITE